MSVLRACPRLEVLHVDDSGPLFVPNNPPVETVVLPALRSFYWKNPSGFHATKVLLRCLVVPEVTHIQLYAAISHEIEALLREGDEYSFGSTVTLLQAVSSCLRVLTLARGHLASPRSHVLKYDSDMPGHVRVLFPSTLRIQEPAPPYLDNLRLCSISQVQSVTLEGISSDDIDAVVGLFHALPNITLISLNDCSCDEGLICALTDQNWKHRVEDIFFNGSDIESETILRFARSRAINPKNPDRSGLTPLRRLSFNRCENILDAILRDLEELVPEVTTC